MDRQEPIFPNTSTKQTVSPNPRPLESRSFNAAKPKNNDEAMKNKMEFTKDAKENKAESRGKTDEVHIHLSNNMFPKFYLCFLII